MMTSMKSSTVASIHELGARKMQGRQCCCKLHTVLVSYKDLTVQHLVVTEDVVQHLLIEILRRRLERDLHTASLLLFQIDIAVTVSRY